MQIMCKMFGHKWERYLDNGVQLRYCKHCKVLERRTRINNEWQWLETYKRKRVKDYLKTLTKCSV